jgi:hypothetical protein
MATPELDDKEGLAQYYQNRALELKSRMTDSELGPPVSIGMKEASALIAFARHMALQEGDAELAFWIESMGTRPNLINLMKFVHSIYTMGVIDTRAERRG